ncbi:MAG: 2-amino-4-hydroxy-6-hydroxymethyldihydropteridine diphosphokinase [Porticoccaceae bacterium]|nr:2-amino-4-hydroxy-6-hydroxymethyldihydropteridine diphosphokinase [Porticoccaceae bacterium]
MNHRVFLGLGSNLGEPKRNILKAVDLVRERTECEAAQLSPLYQTPPFGEVEQPDFVNAVIEVYCSMTPHELLMTCKSIEAEMGREESVRWGPRLIDIDILIFDDLEIDEENLKIPHPGIQERAFVLYPLDDLDKNLELPGLGKTSELKARLDKPEISLL